MTAPLHAVAANPHVPTPRNEPVRDYRPGSAEAQAVHAAIADIGGASRPIPLTIGAQTIHTTSVQPVVSPHDHRQVIGELSVAAPEHVRGAIDAALGARREWSVLPWWERASVFLRAAELVAGKYRAELNAATMVNQS